MANSSMCPCSSCFASTPHYIPAPQQQQQQQQHSTQPEHLRAKRSGKMFGKLRRTRSIESTTSTLVGLTTDAQSMAGFEEK
ncbi:hypothetical protein C8A00DRAFT_17511 [Chaetomidium leptoderma]|uniref:Uncharacterized protein n=1 Tax=Chaetomidium leptoderma TaxID=669021 RepID=A0AAN6VH60_9PEZI|nr:hypothetical protein C8A00DRAFT_17511 [Chaetomidium leptoderma]